MQFTVEQARKYSGITQQQMADILGIDRATYRKLEKDVGRATVRQIGIISEQTGVPIGSIILPFDSTIVDT